MSDDIDAGIGISESQGTLESQLLGQLAGGGDEPSTGLAEELNLDSSPSKPVLQDTLRGRPSSTITPDDIAESLKDEVVQPADDTQADAPQVDQPPPDAVPPAGEATTGDVFEFARKNFNVDLSAKYKSQEEALKGLLNAHQLVGVRNQYAEWGKQLAENPLAVFQALEARFAQQNPQPQTESTAAAQPASQADDVPEYDEAWLQYLNADGTPKQGADPQVLAKIRKWNDFAQKRGQELLRDPAKLVLPAVEKRISEILNQKLGGLVSREEVARQAEQERLVSEGRQLLMEEASWIWNDGDPGKGPTPAGQLFDGFLQQAAAPNPRTGQPRIPDLRDQKEWARAQAFMEMAKNPGYYFPQQQVAPQPNTQPARQPQAAQAAQAISRTPTTKPRPVSQPDDPWPAGSSLAGELMKLLNVE